jgi:hypothetical protein
VQPAERRKLRNRAARAITDALEPPGFSREGSRRWRRELPELTQLVELQAGKGTDRVTLNWEIWVPGLRRVLFGDEHDPAWEWPAVTSRPDGIDAPGPAWPSAQDVTLLRAQGQAVAAFLGGLKSRRDLRDFLLEVREGKGGHDRRVIMPPSFGRKLSVVAGLGCA